MVQQLETLVEALDFSAFYSSNAKTKKQFCNDLVTSMGKHGFVKLVNHGIPKNVVQEAFRIANDFFHLPMEKKMLSPHPPIDVPHRGFSAVGKENIGKVTNFGVDEQYQSKVALKDMKETFDMGSEHDPDWDNVWPPAHVMAEFKPFMLKFWDRCYIVQQDVLEAIATGFDLDPTVLKNMHLHQVNEMRLTHYPEIKVNDLKSDGVSQKTRISPHTDFGSITLLFQDSVGGLEAEDQRAKGVFRPVEAGEIDEMILNAGDCMRFWTGNNIPAARHRVHAPPSKSVLDVNGTGVAESDEMLPERFSVAFFSTPDRSASLAPLKSEWYSEKHSVTMSAGEFQLSRSANTY